MFFSKKKVNPEGNCADCEFGKGSSISDDVLCKYKGIVAPTGRCKKYRKNLLAPPPPKKRGIAGDFTPEDFSLE